MKRSRLSRMLQIMTALQSKRNNRIEDLAKIHKLSRRTIFRDLKELKELGVIFRYDAKDGAYSISPGFFLPPTNLSSEEIMVLLLLAYNARNYIVMPFGNSFLLAAMKLEISLPYKIREFCRISLQDISIKTTPRVRLDLNDDTFSKLQKAILENRVVNMHYYLPSEVGEIFAELSPYHLVFNKYAWFVIGNSSFHKGIRCFRLNRIKEMEVLDECFVRPEKFDVDEYFGRAWFMKREGRLYNVKLKFLPGVARDVAEVQWHNTQKVNFEKDGSAIIEFRVDGLNEIKWWILSYGDHVQVLAPRILQRTITDIAQKVVKSNI
jgi:predicted DNA-binding transcriptional regulator YafY